MGLDAIDRIRRERGFSIEELAMRAGIPISTLSKINAGITKDPKLETVKAIARALECSLDDFNDADALQKNPARLSGEAHQIAKLYDSLDIYGKKAVSSLIKIEFERMQQKVLSENTEENTEAK